MLSCPFGHGQDSITLRMSTEYVLRRTLQSVVLLLLATIVVFMLLRLAPGDPARLMLGEQAPASEVQSLRHNLGLDRPLMAQYWLYLRGLFVGNLGTSIRGQQSVASLIGQALPKTLLLVGAATAVAVLLGIPLGVGAALRPKGIGAVAYVVALLGQAILNFWLGLVLILVFAVHFALLPTSGYGGVAHLVLPVCALAPFLLALVIRVTRQSVKEIDLEDFIRTAYAKGLSGWRILAVHNLKNALPPVVTVVALYAAGMVGGAVVVEVLFAWPGIGELAVNAIVERDYPVVQGVVLVAVLLFLVVNLLVDLGYALLDPRARLR